MEDAAETQNKYFRESCNISLDTLLAGMRSISRKETKPFIMEILELLLPTEPLHMDSYTDELEDTD